MYYHIKNKIIKPFNAIKKNLIIYNSKKNWIIFLKNLTKILITGILSSLSSTGFDINNLHLRFMQSY